MGRFHALLCVGFSLWALTAAAAAAEPRVALPPVAQWSAYGKGYEQDPRIRRGEAVSLCCRSTDSNTTLGALTTLTLNQTKPTPIFLSGWSRAQDVDGVVDNDYSLYADLTFTDGTSLWGQTAPFATGTHPWQQRHLTLFPTKPLRSVNIYALFRSHAGTVWFSDFEARAADSSGVFDGQAIAPPVLAASAPCGWFVRDAASGSALTPLRPGQPALGLRLENVIAKHAGRVVSGSLRNMTDRPRAVSVYYVERFSPKQASWGNDIRDAVPVQAEREYGNLTPVNVGATGQLSLYPFGCVTGPRTGRAVALPPGLGPRVMRIGYHARAGLLYLACDLALAARGDASGHDNAPVAVAAYDVSPRWGFRDAAATYAALFPEAYRRRTPSEGIWMPFTDPAKIAHPEDFHIAFHEGDNSILGDRQKGILSFHYVEPMTYWMPMAKDLPRIYAEAVALVRTQSVGADGIALRQAQAVLTSGSRDDSGRYNVSFRNTPWCDGAVWVLNPNPRLRPLPRGQWSKARLNADLSSPSSHDLPDGEYLDSLEAWADVLDYRPESLRASTLPLTWTTDTFQPVLPTWFSVYEDAAALAHGLHRNHRLLMANSVPWRFHAFLPLLDVCGTETNMFSDTGAWQPEPDAVFNLRRTLSGQKPYLLLLNTDFSKIDSAKIELYFQRCLFYGIYPSMFSANASDHPYWEDSRLYNRDRPLFQKYIPLIQTLSKAGWEPVTWARSNQPNIWVERFGRTYLTVLNAGDQPADATIRIDIARMTSDGARAVHSLVRDDTTGQILATAPLHGVVLVHVHLAASATHVLSVRGGNDLTSAKERP